MTEPGFWMYEESGVLRPVVERFLHGEKPSPAEVPIMRAYLRQWIFAPVWSGDEAIDGLRDAIESLRSDAQIRTWLDKALDLGIDPL